MGRRHTETVVEVVVVRVVPVAESTAGVHTIVVERPAPQDAAFPAGPVTIVTSEFYRKSLQGYKSD